MRMSSHIPFELHDNHVYLPVHARGERLWWMLDTGAGDGTLTGAVLDSPLTVVPGDEPGLGLDVRAALPFCRALVLVSTNCRPAITGRLAMC